VARRTRAVVPSYRQALHDLDELVGIRRVGGIAGRLDFACRVGVAARLDHALVTLALRDEPGVVGQRMLVGVIGAEGLFYLARDAVFVLGRQDVGNLALPAAGGLDAKQVVGVAAVGHADFALAPPRFECGLAHDQP